MISHEENRLGGFFFHCSEYRVYTHTHTPGQKKKKQWTKGKQWIRYI